MSKATETPSEATETPSEATETPSEATENEHRALIVDDDMVALIVVKHMLQTAGLDVTQAANVRAARSLLASESFDVVIADYLMPDGTGLDLLDDVGDTPIILLSGVVERGDLADRRLTDVTAHLTKPVSTEELRSAVMSILSPETTPDP